jgi:hypothetical protein
MGSPASFALTEIGDLSVEYVRRRQMLRVVHTDERRSGTVEVPLPEFLEALGIEPADLAPARHFLLFAGPHHRPAGGLGDLVGTFADEHEARQAFQRLRLSTDYRNGWAEVVEVDSAGRTRALCWFGREPTLSRPGEVVAVRPKPWRWRRSGAGRRM